MTQNVMQTLNDAMSDNMEIRKNAENMLIQFHKMDSFPQSLLEICLVNENPISIRQMSALSLKNYIDTNWYNISNLPGL